MADSESEAISGQMNTEAELLTPEARLRQRINEPGIFPYSKDRDIALDILERLEDRLKGYSIDRQRYDKALAALDRLVPRKNEKGDRSIADLRITPLMEKTIRSRVDSQEIDVASPEGSWGELPEVAKRAITDNGSLLVEMTTECTVRCPFCGFANKGRIREKMSLSSVLKIVRYFKDHRRPPSGLYYADGLYWGTDPFDAKWSVEGRDLDYCDLAEEYWKTIGQEQRFLYTSTAIPIGEEMRVLRFADNFIRKRRKGEIHHTNELRISQTDINKERIQKICEVLEGLYGKYVFDEYVEISDNRSENTALRGKAWNKPPLAITTWDVIGPNCRDDVVIGVRSVDGIVMVAASNERPKGEERFPILEKTEQEEIYRIPQHQSKPDFDAVEDPRLIYPPIWMETITMRGRQVLGRDAQVTANPHRAFLHMVGLLQYFALKRGSKIEGITPKDKATFRSLVAKEAALVRKYLSSGAKNISMQTYMALFEKEGYI